MTKKEEKYMRVEDSPSKIQTVLGSKRKQPEMDELMDLGPFEEEKEVKRRETKMSAKTRGSAFYPLVSEPDVDRTCLEKPEQRVPPAKRSELDGRASLLSA